MATCCVCNEKASMNRYRIYDGWVCAKCYKKCQFKLLAPTIFMKSNRIRDIIEANEQGMQRLNEKRETVSRTGKE